ncbi:P22AR C-terminal domain-containing protein [Actinobacillus porcinus]|uniref:P22AR C-terminal domain-containing protein n=1 Tax=Actinobacillus porcinus TaxID=51048 RepID=UPI0023F13EB3|nr:P22AR C-terminal domain-containing protein [Actinobacillus porcinus]MDD7545611.1 P22AR C-terminal domain-containing protein [Actinobacillus porcinus]MDY5847596.1 P22AR C-terminal domain-containing protein [Actinobacillus porcinus]
MSNLTILKTAIRQFDNLYSLNDLHQISGNNQAQKPSNFTRLETTQELVSEIQKEDPTTQPLKTLRGTQGGTYACEELVLAYAMWISPKFHLVVLRAFLAMHKGELQNQPQQLALPEPEKKYTFELTERELRALVWLWCGHKQMNLLLAELEQPLEAIGSRFSGLVYSHHHEYKYQYEDCKDVIKTFTQPFKQSNDTDWTRARNLITRDSF